MSQQSTDELFREKNAQRIERAKSDFLKRFEDGLESLKSLDIDPNGVKPVNEARPEYVKACHEDLSTIMRDAEAARKAAERGK